MIFTQLALIHRAIDMTLLWYIGVDLITSLTRVTPDVSEKGV
jgi:hypothetical protein